MKRMDFAPNQSMNTPAIGEKKTDGKPFRKAISPIKPAALSSETN